MRVRTTRKQVDATEAATEVRDLNQLFFSDTPFSPLLRFEIRDIDIPRAFEAVGALALLFGRGCLAVAALDDRHQERGDSGVPT